ncbi:MAG: 2-C-methyl-D-erythritol 2,4-cyclodiphosphate synthase [Oscillospiraceae bacterium]|nr:2-C-methyl-D-erythritol 2,4-cyclodiphosphate synthase [Oscillospiraceae bacterium]
MPSVRIGHGYDVHRLVPGRSLILGGLALEHPTGLLGHSDADVLTHAVIDSLLGAAALGDIGLLFPPCDPAYKDASSLGLLRRAAELLNENGYRVANVDATVLAERPRLAEMIPAMRERLAAAMGIETGDISIKATTEEGLGFTGDGSAIAAHSVALIERTI